MLKVGESIVVLQNYWAGVNAGEQGGVSKLVNVPDRSKLVILQEVNLTSEDQKYLKELQASKPQHTIVLEENEKNSSRVGKRLAQWILQPAEQTSALALSALNKSEEHTDPTLHRLDGALVEVDMTTEWRTKKGGVFAKVLLTDHTGQVACRSGSEALLALMQLPGEDESELVRCLESHHWMPQRGDLYVERQVAADRDDPGGQSCELDSPRSSPKTLWQCPGRGSRLVCRVVPVCFASNCDAVLWISQGRRQDGAVSPGSFERWKIGTQDKAGSERCVLYHEPRCPMPCGCRTWARFACGSCCQSTFRSANTVCH